MEKARAQRPKVDTAEERLFPRQPKRDWKGDLAAYRTELPEMKAEAAAERWMALWSAAAKSQEAGAAAELIDLLPPPAAWPHLKKLVESRPVRLLSADPDARSEQELGLRLLVAALTQDQKGIVEGMARLEKAAQDKPGRAGHLLGSLQEVFLRIGADREMTQQILDQNLLWMQAQKEVQFRPLNVLNLVERLGEKPAREWLEKVVLIPGVLLQMNQAGPKTQALAREVVLARLKKMTLPQWELCQSFEAAKLFEATRKHFALPHSLIKSKLLSLNPAFKDVIGRHDHRRRNADAFFFGGQLQRGEVEAAIEMGRQLLAEQPGWSFDYQAERRLREGVPAKQLFATLDAVLKEEPKLPLWNLYINAAVKAGESTAMLERVRTQFLPLMAKGGSDAVNDSEIRSYTNALLAAGETKEAIKILREALPKSEGYDQTSILTQLARLAVLLEEKELGEEVLKVARGAFKERLKELSSGQQGSSRYNLLSMARLVTDLERRAGDLAAADAVAEELVLAGQRNAEVEEDALLMMVGHFAATGRDAEIIPFLEKAKGWPGNDLSQFVERRVDMDTLFRAVEPPIGYLAARAYAGAGNRELAVKILETLLPRVPGHDASYALWVELKGAEGMGLLDQLIALDPFQERPLIWKAQLLLDAGKLEEAHETIKKAIAIDPSDGEQGPGDRMRAYAVLSAIRKAQGDEKEAAFFEGVIAAIRLSEKADRYFTAGLLKEALAMYEESLSHFADAYCIQSRMARQLYEMGKTEEAQAYYQRAFELMPDSFGRVESHCFGCEGAFEGEMQQGIAERLFEGLAKKEPKKPQVHYLLGYLRGEQQRYSEALPSLREAVRLDPDYLNAWKRIADLSEKAGLPTREYDDAIFNMMRLDPMEHHSNYRSDLQKVANFPKLWEMVEEAGSRVPKPPEKLLIVAGAQEDQRQDEATTKTWESPRQILRQHRLLTRIFRMMERS